MLFEELALPLGHRLVGGVATGLTVVALDEALGHGVGDHAGQQRDGTNGVVVTRDREGDLVRVAVGVQDRDDRDTELLRLVNGQVFLLGVNDPHQRGSLGQVADTAQGALQLFLLAAQQQQFLLGVLRTGDVVEVDLFQFLHAIDALGNGGEVGEHAAQPAVVHVGHVHAGGLLGDGFLSLLLGTHEQNGATVSHGVLDCFVGAVNEAQRLLQVNDVDAIALGEDETLHLGVPTAGLVAEVNAVVEHLAHGYDGHVVSC